MNRSLVQRVQSTIGNAVTFCPVISTFGHQTRKDGICKEDELSPFAIIYIYKNKIFMLTLHDARKLAN